MKPSGPFSWLESRVGLQCKPSSRKYPNSNAVGETFMRAVFHAHPQAKQRRCNDAKSVLLRRPANSNFQLAKVEQLREANSAPQQRFMAKLLATQTLAICLLGVYESVANRTGFEMNSAKTSKTA